MTRGGGTWPGGEEAGGKSPVGKRRGENAGGGPPRPLQTNSPLKGGGQRRSQVSLVGGADRIPGGE